MLNSTLWIPLALFIVVCDLQQIDQQIRAYRTMRLPAVEFEPSIPDGSIFVAQFIVKIIARKLSKFRT